jgi:hypothetical protein
VRVEVAGGEGVAVTAVTEEGAVGFLRSGKKKEERRWTEHGGMVKLRSMVGFSMVFPRASRETQRRRSPNYKVTGGIS